MDESSHRLHLIPEQVLQFSVARLIGQNQLDGNVATVINVKAVPDLSHTTASDGGQELERSDGQLLIQE